MEQSFKMQVNVGVASDHESDEVKRIFLEGNPVLLGITMVGAGGVALWRAVGVWVCWPSVDCQLQVSTVPALDTQHPQNPKPQPPVPHPSSSPPLNPHHPTTQPNTQAVSMLHSVFDFLAFKNDVAFWKDNRSMEGLSARSIMVNAFCQLVILFYLLDNDTSTVVLISSGAGAGR